MIKKLTDEILDNPKDRDVKKNSQDEAVDTRKLILNQLKKEINNRIKNSSDSKLGKSHGAHDSCKCHQHSHRIRSDGQSEQ